MFGGMFGELPLGPFDHPSNRNAEGGRRGPRAKRADFEQGLPSYSAFRNPKSAGEDSSKENRQSDRQPSIAFLALGKMRGWLTWLRQLPDLRAGRKSDLLRL